MYKIKRLFKVHVIVQILNYCSNFKLYSIFKLKFGFQKEIVQLGSNFGLSLEILLKLLKYSSHFKY